MGKDVYANGNAIAAKVGGGKVIAAFPDVCMSPPPPPAGPIPIPYPNSSFSADLKKGSKTVKIGDKPFALKDSFYKTSPLGNEAATKNFGAAILSHQTSGKTQFIAYSFDVKADGKNVCRHVDFATSNHGSYPGSTPPFPDLEKLIQVAKDRIAEHVCPCCNASDCPAAFKSEADDANKQNMAEHYGMEEKGANGQLTPLAAERLEIYGQMLKVKESHCTCEGEVFPKPPCDVFRAPDKTQGESNRKKKIEKKWGEMNQTYFANWHADPKNAGKVDRFIAANPNETKPRPPSKHNKNFGKVNHLTPKSGGGCPDNPGNLQPHDLLCKACKQIDDTFGDWQGNNDGTEQKWRDAFREGGKLAGIKRRAVKGFRPSSW